MTDASGNVTSRKDYTAFGEETFTSQRTTGLGYNPQNVRQDYTGYQKDNESGLEYAQARYYNPLHGRFTSPDPLTASATIRDPQTFNRYSYGLNSPYKFTDSLGLTPMCQGPGGGQTYSCDGNDENGAPKHVDCPPGKKCYRVEGDQPGLERYIVDDGEEVITGEPTDSSGSVVDRIENGLMRGFSAIGLGPKAAARSLWHIGEKLARRLGFDPGGKPIPSPTDTAPGDGTSDGGGDNATSGGDDILLQIALHVAEYYIREMLNEKPLDDGYIYRPNTTETDAAATPRPQDLNGLSATLVSCEGQPRCRVYDVAKIRASGQLNVVNDHGKHVAIFPNKALDLFIWMQSRRRFQHPYTKIIQEAKVK